MKTPIIIITSFLVALAGQPAYAVCTGNNYRTPACPAPDPRHIRYDAYGNPLPDDPNSSNATPYTPPQRGPAAGGVGGYPVPVAGYGPGPAMGASCVVGPNAGCPVSPAQINTPCYCVDPNTGMQYNGAVSY